MPKYRGASPINRAILEDDKETGVTVIKMTERMDAGDILLQKVVSIKSDEAAPTLFKRLALGGASLMVKTLDIIEAGNEKPHKQDEAHATYASRLKKADGQIDWSKSARKIECHIRAMQPWPGTFTKLNGKNLKIYGAKSFSVKGDKNSPGTIINQAKFVVKAGEGAVMLEEMQLEGKRRMHRREFLKGQKIKEGTVLGS